MDIIFVLTKRFLTWYCYFRFYFLFIY